LTFARFGAVLDLRPLLGKQIGDHFEDGISSYRKKQVSLLGSFSPFNNSVVEAVHKQETLFS
jgi:hypothetical protein